MKQPSEARTEVAHFALECRLKPLYMNSDIIQGSLYISVTFALAGLSKYE